MKKFGLLIASVCLFVWNGKAQITECDINDQLGQNLISNGDFEQGNTGFNTDLALFSGGGSAEFYYVGSDAKVFNAAFNASDNTSGTGNMLMLDASNDINKTRMWYQLVEVKPNTNYFFTANIANILGPTSQIIPQLVFSVNGEVLKDTIDAPLNTFEWNSFTSEWYSGANPPQFVEISIENIKIGGTGEGGGNDMALDDISFIEGCGFGGLGEEPNLGDDIQTICGSATGELVLAAEVTPGVTYEYKWDSPNAGDTTNSLTVTQPGVYGLCMTTNGSCPRLKTVTVTNDFSVSLGDDVDLCSPATTTLVPDYFDGEKYDWSKDGEDLGQFKNEKSATVNTVGTYKLVVTDANASCGTREDEVIVSSSTIQAVNGYFCPDDALAVDLSITNMVSDASNYKWYSDEALTAEVATGGTFSTPADLTETTTYWVKDESTQDFTTGVPVAIHNGGYAATDKFDYYIEFKVENDFVLETVDVYPVYYNANTTQTFGYKILDVDNGLNQIALFDTVYTGDAQNNGSLTSPLSLPVGISFEKGKTYQIRKVGGGNAQLSGTGWDASHNPTPQILTITPNNNWDVIGFYDWKISAGSPCDPIEVQAIYDPVRCTNCESPTDLTIDITAGVNPIKCPSDEITLSATVVGGIGTWDYAWTLNGQPTGTNSSTITVAKADAGNYAVSVKEQLEGDVCTASSDTETITTEDAAEASVLLNTELSQAQCLVGGVTATAADLNITSPVYTWTVNGDNAQSQNLNSLTLNVASGDVVQVTVTGKDECDEDVSETASATIIGEDEITPSVSINGANGLCDTETAALTATITPSDLTNITYDWTVTGGLTSTDPTYNVDLNDGDVIDLTVTFGGNECLTSTTATNNATASVISSFTPSVTINDPGAICVNELPLTVNVGGAEPASNVNTFSFEWFKNGTESIGTGTSVIIQDLETGDEVTAVVTSSAACATSTGTSNIVTAEVNPMVDVSVTLSGNNGGCSGNDVTITANVEPVGTPGTFAWSVDGDVKTETSNVYTSGLYIGGETVSVVFEPTAECLINDQVSPIQDFNVTFEDPSVNITSLYEGDLCSGKDNGFKVIKDPSAGDNPTYSWTLNSDPTVLSTDDFIERADFMEGDTVKLLMTPDPSLGCPDAYAFDVLGAFQDAFEISLNIQDSVLCNGSSLTIRASTLNGGLEPKFQWYKNDVVMVDDTMSSISVTGDQDDEYKVVFESSLYCIDDTLATDSITLTVIDVPVAEAGPDVVLDDYISTELDGEGSSIGDVEYWWYSSDTLLHESMIGRDAIKMTVVPREKLTTFKLRVSRTEENVTCSAYDSATVTVDFDFPIPNAFSPNGDGSNDVFEIDNLDKLDSFTLQIYNRWGSLLYEQESATDFWDGTNGGSPVPASTYFYLFTYELDGETTTTDGYISLIR